MEQSNYIVCVFMCLRVLEGGSECMHDFHEGKDADPGGESLIAV